MSHLFVKVRATPMVPLEDTISRKGERKNNLLETCKLNVTSDVVCKARRKRYSGYSDDLLLHKVDDNWGGT